MDIFSGENGLRKKNVQISKAKSHGPHNRFGQDLVLHPAQALHMTEWKPKPSFNWPWSKSPRPQEVEPPPAVEAWRQLLSQSPLQLGAYLGRMCLYDFQIGSLWSKEAGVLETFLRGAVGASGIAVRGARFRQNKNIKLLYAAYLY